MTAAWVAWRNPCPLCGAKQPPCKPPCGFTPDDSDIDLPFSDPDTAPVDTAPRIPDWVMLRDDSAAHQIRIGLAGGSHLISVSCTCRATGGVGNGTRHYRPLETRSQWNPGEAPERWRQHMAEIGEVA